jgi:hypothetical protein
VLGNPPFAGGFEFLFSGEGIITSTCPFLFSHYVMAQQLTQQKAHCYNSSYGTTVINRDYKIVITVEN